MSHIKNIERFIKDSPFQQLLNFEFEQIEPGQINASISVLPYLKRFDGVVHGGFISYFADTLLGFAGLTMLDDDKTVFTAEMKVSFMNPAIGDKLFAEAKVLRTGKTLQFCEVDVFSFKENGERYLASKASGTLVVADRK